MLIEQHKSLVPYNTFHIGETARYFVSVKNETELLEVLDSSIAKENELFIIGGGSNILLTREVNGLVIHNEMKGIARIYEDEDVVRIKFQAGENWHQCVLWCVEQQLGGIENLSLIPGTIGAAPIQNIGAYGAELKDVFVELEALDLASKQKMVFTKEACAFGYRNSIFKQEAKGKYIILSVTLQLSKKPVFNISYGHIQQELDAMGIRELNLKAVSDAVIRIRQSKLPDPAVIGNAGSFFKNPTISQAAFESLQKKHRNMPSYKNETGVKIPAAWLIEHCHPENEASWKGYREQNYGIHAKQALCLVNYSDANGKDIFDLSTRVITSVQQAFNITLEREVNIW
jgi:UDP-N-acetylmuramate dehydrogenase